MKREVLKEMGLTDEQIDKVMAEHGNTVNPIKKELDDAKKASEQIEEYKKQIDDRDKQLKDLGEKAKGNEELTNTINELKQQNETTKTEYEQKLQKQQFDHTLENALSAAKVKNPKAVKALLDTENIKLDGDKLLGLDDQLKNVKESDPYLFEEDKNVGDPPPSFTTGKHKKDGGGNEPSSLADALSQRFSK